MTPLGNERHYQLRHSKSLNDSPKSLTESQKVNPTFKCEICQVYLPTEKKLQLHIQYSPLHLQNQFGDSSLLNVNNGSDRPELNKPPSPKQSSTSRQRLIYSGSKIFWRTNQTLEINMYEDSAIHCILVGGCDTRSNQEFQPLCLNISAIEEYLNSTAIPKSDEKKESIQQALKKEKIVKFILARLQIAPGNGGKLCLVKLSSDTYDNVLFDKQLPIVKIERKRRSTLDDMKNLHKELTKDTEDLKAKVEVAYEKSNIISLSLNTFRDLSKSTKKRHTYGNSIETWKNCFNRVTHKEKTSQTRELISKKMESSGI